MNILGLIVSVAAAILLGYLLNRLVLYAARTDEDE